jgi:hypothetical protein
MLRTSIAALLFVAMPGSAWACGMAMAEDDRMLASVFDEIDNAKTELTPNQIADINASNEQLAQQAIAKRQTEVATNNEPAVVDSSK